MGSQGEMQSFTVSGRMYTSALRSWISSQGWELFQELLTTLRRVADEKGAELGEPGINIAIIASQWVLDRVNSLGGGGSVIIGIRDARHLKDHETLLKYNTNGTLKLSDAHHKQILAVLDRGNFPSGKDIWSEERGDGWDDPKDEL